jgi:putative tryptophan/tyrosine transport system substrate-binding protein
MQRREFITLLGGVAVTWPLGVHAQPSGNVRLVGLLLPYAENDPEAQLVVAAFRNTFQGLGWTEGRNVRIEIRWPGVNLERLKDYAPELVALAPDAIFCGSNYVLAELSHLTRTIPIVFVQVSDPVGSGFVTGLSLARPGGNITGFTTFEPTMGGKWLETLKEIAPRVSRVAVLLQPQSPANVAYWRAAEASGPSLEVKVSAASVQNDTEIEHAIATVANLAGGGLIVLPNPITLGHRNLIIELAARHRLPAIYPFSFFAASGGLLSYGIDLTRLYRDAAGYVDRILKGEKPGDLPIQQPTKFELAINLKTAKALGLAVPPSLLTRADNVIE